MPTSCARSRRARAATCSKKRPSRSPAVGAGWSRRLRPGPEPARPQLSGRETEILGRAARGLTNAEIGRDLYISEATVKTHLLRACAKLGVSGRTAAVAVAAERGLLR